MTILKTFTEEFNRYVDEIGCMGNPNGYMGSHKIESKIWFEDSDGNEYDFEDFEIHTLGGCGCWSSISIKIKKV